MSGALQDHLRCTLTFVSGGVRIFILLTSGIVTGYYAGADISR